MSKRKPPKKAPQKSIEERLEELARIEYRKKVEAGIQTIGAIGTLKKRWELEEAEKVWEAQNSSEPRRVGVFNPGDIVVYTARFLYQSHGAPLDLAKEFVIQECSCELCELGNHVCTTEWLAGYDMFRHISRCAVRHKGMLCVDELPTGLQPRLMIPNANYRALTRAERKAAGIVSDLD